MKEKMKYIVSWGVIRKFIEIIIIIIIIILIKFKYISIERLIIFFIIILIISFYLLLAEIIEEGLKKGIEEEFYINYKLEKEEIKIMEKKVEEKKKKYEKKIIKIVKILVIIQNIINPFYFFMIYFIKCFFFFFRGINLKLEKYEKIRKIIYKSIMYFIIMPIDRIYRIYYKIIERGKNKTFIEIIFYRIEGLIISIIFFSDILKYFNIFYIIILIYLLLICFDLLPERIRKENFKYLGYGGFGQAYRQRNEVTIIGNVIKLLYNNFNLKYNKKEDYGIILDVYGEGRYSTKISHFMYNIANCVHHEESILKEIKNKPSFFLFIDLYYLFEEKSGEYFIGKEKLEDEDLKKVIKLYVGEKERIKNMIFFVGEIEELIERKRTKVNICKYYMELTMVQNEKCEFIDEKELTIKNFNIERKKIKFKDIKEYYNEICEKVLKFEEIDENYDGLGNKLEEKNIGLLIAHFDEKIKEKYVEEMSEFLKEIEKEFLLKKNKI